MTKSDAQTVVIFADAGTADTYSEIENIKEAGRLLAATAEAHGYAIGAVERQSYERDSLALDMIAQTAAALLHRIEALEANANRSWWTRLTGGR